MDISMKFFRSNLQVNFLRLSWGIACEICLRWMSLHITNHKSTLLETAQWLGVVRQQTITWTNVDPGPCSPMTSLGHNELTQDRGNSTNMHWNCHNPYQANNTKCKRTSIFSSKHFSRYRVNQQYVTSTCRKEQTHLMHENTTQLDIRVFLQTQINRLKQKRRNSIASAMELRLFCINHTRCYLFVAVN